MISTNAYIALKVLNASSWQSTIIHSSLASSMLLSIYWGGIIRRHPKTEVIFYSFLGGCLILSLVGFINPFAEDAWLSPATQFTLFILFANLIFGMLPIAINSVCRLNYPTERRTEIVASIRVFQFVVMTTFAIVSSYLLTRYPQSMRFIYPFMATCGVIAAFYYRRIIVRGEQAQLEIQRSEDFVNGKDHTA